MNVNNKAFTLIELLIVVSIIGILSGLIIVVINPAKFTGRARDGVRKQDLSIIKAALEQYYAEKNQYPPSSEIKFGSTWPNYLKSVPQDPRFATYSWTYCYSRSADMQNYSLCARVEDSSNSNGSDFCGNPTLEDFISYCVQNSL